MGDASALSIHLNLPLNLSLTYLAYLSSSYTIQMYIPFLCYSNLLFLEFL